jgi:Peptidase family M28
VIDFRIYRAGFLPALVAVVVLLFALQAPPGPLPAVVAPAEFDQAAAMQYVRQIVAAGPTRTPGSSGDAAAADLVEKQFRQVTGGQVAEQQFSSTFDGADVGLRNVILTLPGDTPRTVVVIAARDSASGPGAASSAAATATLLELVNEIRSSGHHKTLVFVSTDGSSDGAQGAREFISHYPQRDEIDAAVVVSQPGSAIPRQPYLLDSSDGPQSANSQLVQTATRALVDQAQRSPAGVSLFGELSRLALPTGLGEQAVLIEDGIPAVGLSSAGERPLRPADDQLDEASATTLGAFGRAALLLAATLDAAPSPPEHGPSAYLTLAGNLVPGWTLALLTVTLLLPAGLATLDGILRARRANGPVGWALGWSTSRAVPLLVALLLLYFMAAVGIVARPAFPFDPNRFGVGVGQAIAMAFLVLVVAGGYYAIRCWRVPARLPLAAAAPALGLVSMLAVALALLVNPYLALLLVPVPHVWLLCARRAGPLPWPAVLVAAAISVVPLGTAIADVAARLDLGSGAPWQLLLMVDDGQIGFGAVLALCLLAGCLVGIVALAARRPASAGPPRATPSRPQASPAEPEPGPPMDASPIAPSGADDDQEGGRYAAHERWPS